MPRPSLFGSEIKDYGEDISLPCGFSFKKGNEFLPKLKQNFLDEAVLKKYPNFEDLIRAINQEKSWQILEHINLTGEDFLKFASCKDKNGTFSGKWGMDGIKRLTELALNSAFYSSNFDGAPGYEHQNTILLRNANDPNSVISDILTPNLYQRITNMSFWERPTFSSKDIYNIPLEDQVKFLDPVFVEEGLNAFCRGIGSSHSSAYQVDFYNVPPQTMRMYGEFLGKAILSEKINKLNFHQSIKFIRAFVSPYLDALTSLDMEFEKPIYTPEQRRVLAEKFWMVRDAFPSKWKANLS